MSVISEIILTLEEFAEEFMAQNLISREVFQFEAGVDEAEEIFTIAMRLCCPNVMHQFSDGLKSYIIHRLPVEALVSIYEADGLNEYLEDHVEPQMPTRISLSTFILPNGYEYTPKRNSVLVASMPTSPPISLVTGMPNGIEPRRHSLSVLKNRTNQTGGDPFIINTNLCQEVLDDDWLESISYTKAKDHLDAMLLMHDEIYKQKAKQHVNSNEQSFILRTSS